LSAHAGHPDADLLLWRGVEMVEILSMLNMDIETLQAALLFPSRMRTWSAKTCCATASEIRRRADPRRARYGGHSPAESHPYRFRLLEQVDNVRRMLLAMVDDFRCVVIKLAERIAHLREVKDAPEDERVLAAKECTNIYAPLANR
jgi:GTP pyrophosphokinase